MHINDTVQQPSLPSEFSPVSSDTSISSVYSFRDLLVVEPKTAVSDTAFVFNEIGASGFSFLNQGILQLHLNKYDPYDFGYTDFVKNPSVMPVRKPTAQLKGVDLFDALFLFNDALYGVQHIHAIWNACPHHCKGLGTNITQYNNNINMGYAPEDAAAHTFTGRRANLYGFHPERILMPEKNYSGTCFESVEVLFSRS